MRFIQPQQDPEGYPEGFFFYFSKGIPVTRSVRGYKARALCFALLTVPSSMYSELLSDLVGHSGTGFVYLLADASLAATGNAAITQQYGDSQKSMLTSADIRNTFGHITALPLFWPRKRRLCSTALRLSVWSEKRSRDIC